MKLFAAIYAKYLAKSNLSLNNWELCDKIGFKRPNMVVIDSILVIYLSDSLVFIYLTAVNRNTKSSIDYYLVSKIG